MEQPLRSMHLACSGGQIRSYDTLWISKEYPVEPLLCIECLRHHVERTLCMTQPMGRHDAMKGAKKSIEVGRDQLIDA